MEVNDNVIPASNSTMANNFFVLSHHYDRADYNEKAIQMLNNVIDKVYSYPAGYSNWLNLLINQVYPFYEVAVVGKDATDKSVELHSTYIPNKMLCGAIKESTLPLLENRYSKGQTRIFVCENKLCQMPTEETELSLIHI